MHIQQVKSIHGKGIQVSSHPRPSPAQVTPSSRGECWFPAFPSRVPLCQSMQIRQHTPRFISCTQSCVYSLHLALLCNCSEVSVIVHINTLLPTLFNCIVFRCAALSYFTQPAHRLLMKTWAFPILLQHVLLEGWGRGGETGAPWQGEAGCSPHMTAWSIRGTEALSPPERHLPDLPPHRDSTGPGQLGSPKPHSGANRHYWKEG